MTLDKSGVAILLAHLVITLFIIGGYIFTFATGHENATLQSGVLLALGYWFGAIDLKKVKSDPTPPTPPAPTDTTKGGGISE